MDSGFYAAYTGLVARMQELDVTANNLANVNTTGYKAGREFFSAVLAANREARLSPLNQAVNDFGILGGAALNLEPGSLDRTGNDLDLAIEGRGFFSVQTKAGVRYTRNGSFHLSTTGELLTAQGDPLLGPKGTIRITGQPISISTDGTVSSKGTVVTRLSLVDFPHGTPLTAEGGTYIDAPSKAAKPATNASVRQGYLESSNYSAVTGMVGLVALQQHAGMLRNALTIFNNTFDKSASEDLPRISG